MSKKTKRLRLFAGPNGSGKTTYFEEFKEQYDPGLHINADKLKQTLQQDGEIDFQDLKIKATHQSFIEFQKKKSSKSLKQKARRAGVPILLDYSDGILISKSTKPTAYEASYIAAFIRSECLRLGISFSYESVMSHSSKLKELKEASQNGFRTYLYYICTESPIINIERVKLRVKKGGHDVPKEKIESRYYKSLEQVLDASTICNRAYFFDSSRKTDTRLLAEMEEGEKLTIHDDTLNQWFVKHVLKPFGALGP